MAKLPYIEIFSPTFFWNDEADFVRTGSTTCPKGRAITGGLSIQQGKASLRILESYPDGESWVMRVVNRQKPDNVQSLQVRGFALCMLPAARKASVLLTQQTKLLHVSSRFGLPSGFVSTTGRQACPQGALVVSGGFGLDPEYRGTGRAAPGAELSRSERLERPGGQRRAGDRARPPTRAPTRSASAPRRAPTSATSRTCISSSKDVTVKADNGTARQPVGCGEGAYVLAGGIAHGEGAQRQRRDAGKLPRLAGKLDGRRDQPRRQESRRRDREALRGVHQEVGDRGDASAAHAGAAHAYIIAP